MLAGVEVRAEDGEGSVGDELRSGVLCDGDARVNTGLGLVSGVIGSMATDGAGTKAQSVRDLVANIMLVESGCCSVIFAAVGLELIVAIIAGSFFAPSATHLKNG